MITDNLFNADWKATVKNDKRSWALDVLENRNENGLGDIYLKCISRWFSEMPGSNKQKNHLKASLKSLDNTDHLGAVNELSWWVFWVSRGFIIEPIPTGKNRTPDFCLKLEDLCVMFEVTTLNPSKDGRCNEINYSEKNSLKRIIVKMYDEKIGQFQYAYNKKMPVVLVLYNYDEFTGFGVQFNRDMNKNSLFGDTLLELSAIIYVERYVQEGKPMLKKDSIKVVDNPNAEFPFPEEAKKQIMSAAGIDNWIDCERA